MGNLIRLLAKRKADEEALRSADADEGVEESPSKRDIRVSTKLTSESEDERHRKQSQKPASDGSPLPSLRLHMIAASLVGIGRTRRAVRQTVSVPLGTRAKAIKFSAAFEEDDSFDSTTMTDKDDTRNGKNDQTSPTSLRGPGWIHVCS